VEPEQPSPDTEHESLHEEAHLPSPSLWPIGFAIGIVVALVGLIIDPLFITTIGAAIAIVFGFLWARDATRELRGQPVDVEPERREAAAPPADAGAASGSGPLEPVTRSVFLEGATLGLGGVIGAMITLPVVGFMVLPGFIRQKQHKVDLGPIEKFPVGSWFVATFIVDPAQGGRGERRSFATTAPSLKTGKQVPSFTIISNRCTHVGCPTQANGPTRAILGTSPIMEHPLTGLVKFDPVVPAGYGCPCHGSQFDIEGNRTAGPAVRALDRYDFEINHGRLVLLSTYSVSHVVGTGGQAKIYKYKQSNPGDHVDGPEAWFYPLQPPHH
jgi:Rieske Fe-S protein